ncbi:MAG: patatin-like phospholipase family protein [Prolixibacteraceae bacterium]|nr:patatin-like phospholipase family protein [Prolixibacteraceae bacterium]
MKKIKPDRNSYTENNQKAEMEFQTGFALSGGGMRGFAHLGVAEALAERGIRPDVIAGVSVGSIVGAFLAAGIEPQQTLEKFKNRNLFKYTTLQLPTNGLLRLSGLLKIVEQEVPFSNIEDLPIPLYIGVTNIKEGGSEYLSKGPLAKSILASSSIPVLFAPVEIEGKLYADGGVLENIPLKPLAKKCKNLIVVNVSPLQKDVELKNLIQVVMRVFHLNINSQTKDVKKHANLYFEPEELMKYDILNTSHADDIFEIGYNSVKKLDNALFDKILEEKPCEEA